MNDVAEGHGFTVFTTTALPMDSPSKSISSSQREQTITLIHFSKLTDVSHHIEKLAREQGLFVVHRSLVDPNLVISSEWEGTGRIIVLAELERITSS